MKHLHYRQCLVGVAIVAVVLVALGVSASTLAFLAVALACPLMMLVMMRTMGDAHASARHDESSDDTARATEQQPREPRVVQARKGFDPVRPTEATVIGHRRRG